MQSIPPFKILILDGTPRGTEISASLRRHIVAEIVKADSLSALAYMARAFRPDLAILAADHPKAEKDLAEKLLRELDPEIEVLRL